MLRYLLFIFLFVSINTLFGQNMLSNDGALISIKDGGFVSVLGDYHSDNEGIIDNTDTVFITGDWENNAGNTGFNFKAGGSVVLRGDSQTIKGTDVTLFGHLHLRGTNTKFGAIDVDVDSTLILNDKEFSMDTNTVTIFNVDTGSVTRTDGFVSSLQDGGLARRTGSIEDYLFPVGSSLGTFRYRPIEIMPNSSRTKIYKVRMANVDATTEGFDRQQRDPTICVINEQYYHRIYAVDSATGAAADLRFFFDPALDGDFTDVLHWQNLPQWEITEQNPLQGFGGAFSTLEILAWTDYTEPAFALGNASEPFDLDAELEFCLGDTLDITALDEHFSSYQFFVNNELVQDSIINVFTTDGILDADSVYAIGVDTTCIAYSYPLSFTAYPVPSPEAMEDTTVYFGADVTLTGTGGVNYEWAPDSVLDCSFCDEPLANVFEDTKFYMTAFNEYGCKAIDTVWIFTSENIDPNEVLYIPNAITPNGDGVNEVWNIRNIDLYTDNEAIIINRWGDEIFRSNGPYQNDFDGTYKGTPIPAGTYYYLLKLNNIGQVLNGPLTVIR